MPEAVIAAPIKHQFETAEQQREAATMGMWLFLATEVLLFGGMFLGYTIYRVSYPQAYADASRHSLMACGSINTAILLSSSCVMAFAVRAARANRSGALALLLLVTALLGAVFLGIKGVEYLQEISERLLPGGGFHIEASDPAHSEMFFYLYWLMTGVHATGLERLDPARDLLIITAVGLGTAVLMWLTFRSSARIGRRLGPIGLNIVTRVMWILVTATALQPRVTAASGARVHSRLPRLRGDRAGAALGRA